MFPTAAVGDFNMMMGVIMTGNPTVLVSGRPIAVLGMSLVSPHPWGGIPPKPIHPPSPLMINCSTTVLAGGLCVGHMGSISTCLHAIIPPCNPTVLVGI